MGTPYQLPTSGQCNGNDIFNTLNNLCYTSGTYSPMCSSGDTYIPNNNLCINIQPASPAPYASAGATCMPGDMLIGLMCYPPNTKTYSGICNIGDTSQSSFTIVGGIPNTLSWCISQIQLDDQTVYNNNFANFLNLQNEYTNAAVSCSVSYNVFIALTIPIILVLFLIICYLSFKYGLISSIRNTNRS